MKLDDVLKNTVTAVIRDNFAEGEVVDVEFESIELAEDGATITIKVVFTVDSKPDDVAEHYFGLTGKVRSALGEAWQEYFPVISPSFGREEHA